MPISSDEFEGMIDDCADLLGHSIDLNLVSSGAFTVATGTESDSLTTLTIAALREDDEAGLLDAGGGADTRTRRYRVKADDCTREPRAGDYITDPTAGSERYDVVAVEEDVDGLSYVLICERKS